MSNITLKIDPIFRDLIPRLSDDEFTGLEKEIVADRICRDKLVVWNGTIVDGHHRYEICKKHNIPFEVLEKDFKDKDEAIIWSIQNQLYRRNVNDITKIELVRKYENVVERKAKERMFAGKPNPVENFPQGTDNKKARDELGKLAGVSGKQYKRGTKILDVAPKPIVNAVRSNEVSINQAFQVANMQPELQREAVKKVEEAKKNAKSVKKAVNDFIKEVKEKKPLAPVPAKFEVESEPYTIDDLVDELRTTGQTCMDGLRNHIGLHINIVHDTESFSKILDVIQWIADGFCELKEEVTNEHKGQDFN